MRAASPRPPVDRAAFGENGERIVAVLYTVRGYRILGRRVRTPQGEVDLVCRRGRTLVVVEVKRRRVADVDGRWVTHGQLERIRAAAAWLRREHRWARASRVDLVTIEGWRVRTVRGV